MILLFSPSCWALGPVDGELLFSWWGGNAEADLSGSGTDAESYGVHGNIWLADRWGLQGEVYHTELEGPQNLQAQTLSLDIKRRLVSATDNNFVAVGLGWENLDLDGVGNSAGPRLLLEGRVGLGSIVFLYGQGAWLPQLDDVEGRHDLQATEFEAGLSITPFPFLSLRAGYRELKIDFKQVGGANAQNKSKGLVLGAGFHW